MRSSFAVLVVVATHVALLSCGSPAVEPAVTTCLSGANCDGVCVQLATDGAHCGACGVSCTAGQVCSGGQCAVSCAAPLAACGAGVTMHCADLRSDPTSCGSCGHACADGQLCAGGSCVETCSAPLTACTDGTSSSCADLRFDPGHCGSCDNACAAGGVCSAGECRPACTAPLTACGTGAGGRCLDLRNDPDHCGACDVACPTDQACTAGVCGPSCAAPLAVCGVGEDAHCVDLRSDVTSCGTCGHACGAGQACLAGACVATCEGSGGTLCDGTCVDLAADDANCGACGNACPGGTACHGGACAVTCPAGKIPCGDGCLDPSADPQNCGACGNVCATGLCRAGECAATTCTSTIGLPAPPFAPPSTAHDQPWDHAFADLDGDGVLDFALPRMNDGVVEIRYVVAPGVLGPPVNVPVASKPAGIAAGDVDGDGRPDLVACSSGGTGTISLLRNHGDGTFDRADFPASGAVSHCALGDLDGDGRPDLVLTYPGDARIAVALNTGGAFAPPVSYPSAKPFPRNVELADLDGDGKLDAVVVNASFATNGGDPDIDQGSVSVFPGVGDGRLGAPATYASGVLGLDVVIADLDGDGWLDVAIAVFGDEVVSILLNNGGGGLLPRITFAVGNRPISLAAGDLDGDGSIDLIVNRYYDDVAILRNDGHAEFAAPETYPIRTEEIGLADADGDGVLDLFDASGWPQLVKQEAGRLVTASAMPVAADDERVVLTDLDRDGHPDAVLASSLAGPVVILRGLADGSFAPPTSLTTSGANRLATGDIDGDGNVDLVYVGHAVYSRRNLGNGTFGPEQRIPAPSTNVNSSLTLGDLDGDGDLDLVITFGFELPGSVQVLWNDGSGTFELGPRLTTGWDSRAAVIGPLTGGGRPDIVVPNWMDGTVSVFRGHAGGSFTLYATLPVPSFSEAALIADVTQDGRTDLVVAGPGDESPFNPKVRIYPGLDHGLGGGIDLPAGTFVFPQDLAVADLDSDGRRDLIVVGSGKIAWHRALDGGGFAAPVVYASNASTSVAIRDLTGDFRSDLVTVGDGVLMTHVNRCFAH